MFKRKSVFLALAFVAVLGGCSADSGDKGGDGTEPGTHDPAGANTVGADHGRIEYVDQNTSAFIVFWRKDSNGTSDVDVVRQDQNTGTFADDRKIFFLTAGVKPGAGQFNCVPTSETDEKVQFYCYESFREDGGEEKTLTDTSFYLKKGMPMMLYTHYYDVAEHTSYHGELIGTLEWDGSQVIVN